MLFCAGDFIIHSATADVGRGATRLGLRVGSFLVDNEPPLVALYVVMMV